MRRALLILALVSPVVGCATSSRPLPSTVASAPSASANRGLFLALHTCAACHAVGSRGASPDGVAPTFPVIRLRYNEISLERRLVSISKNGHVEMPPISMSAEEIRDIIAYIETVGPTASHDHLPGADQARRDRAPTKAAG